jgi:hypothetical protein
LEGIDYLLDINLRMLFSKFKSTAKINMPPGNGRNTLDCGCFFLLSSLFCLGKQRRLNICVTEDDAIGDEPCAFAPDMLFKLRSDPKFSLIVVEYRPLQLVIRFTPG